MEIFLIVFLNVEEKQAIEDAKLIKSVISKETEEKLYKYTNKLLNFKNIGCKCNYGKEKDKCNNCVNVKIRNKVKSKKIGKSF